MNFYNESDANMEEAVRVAIEENEGNLERYLVMEVETYSSDGNKYYFSTWHFDHEPSYDELLKCATEDFEEYYTDIGDEYTEVERAEKIKSIADDYIVVDSDQYAGAKGEKG